MSVETDALESMPTPDVIRSTAEAVMARKYYRVDTAGGPLSDVMQRIADLAGRIIRPITDAFGALHDISPFLAWLVIFALFVIAVGLIVHIGYSFRVAVRARRRRGVEATGGGIDSRDPIDWEAGAGEARDRGDYVSAIRFLFRSCLLRVELSRKQRLRPGITNRELLRRFGTSSLRDPLSVLVEMIDRKWFGRESCTETEFLRGAEAYESIRRQMTEGDENAHDA